jgi:hypothetical protein
MWILVRNGKMLINTDKIKRFYIEDIGVDTPDFRILYKITSQTNGSC